MNTRQQLGKQGERIATRYLQEHGYIILEKNYRCAFGEIDVIAQKDNLYVFVEVKTRYSKKYGLPQAAVNKKKRVTLQKVGWFYLKSHAQKNVKIRFDCVAIILDKVSGNILYFNHIQNIFL